MKAKIRKTGEIVDVICYGGSPILRSDVLDYVNYIDSQGVEHTQPNHLNYYWDFEPVEITTDEYWQDIRNQAAIAAMQGVMNFFGSIDYNKDIIAKLAVEQADALIEELKKQGESKPAEWSEEDEKIRKEIISFLKGFEHDHYRSLDFSSWITWVKKQFNEYEPNMIQWKGNNLKEVIDFTGKDKNFDKWFKSFEEYKEYVHEHNNIFKLFNEDGSHYEVPVGAWIVKTPDGCNVASKAIFNNKSVEWSKEDEKIYQSIMDDTVQENQLDDKQTDWLKSIKQRMGG